MLQCPILISPTILLLDIDGVIRDVAGSYRRAVQETVQHYSGWFPTAVDIDALKGEGVWNNDWDASLELLRRFGAELPDRQALINVFSGFYFGGNPEGPPEEWTGFIRDEPLLVDADFFAELSRRGIRWGFVSGAEPPSARFVLKRRLGLNDPPLIAMGDAPDKPDPSGLIRLAKQLSRDEIPGTVAYLGDTVADIHTVLNARSRCPDWDWISLGVIPPHVRQRADYRSQLQAAGAEQVLETTLSLLELIA